MYVYQTYTDTHFSLSRVKFSRRNKYIFYDPYPPVYFKVSAVKFSFPIIEKAIIIYYCFYLPTTPLYDSQTPLLQIKFPTQYKVLLVRVYNVGALKTSIDYERWKLICRFSNTCTRRNHNRWELTRKSVVIQTEKLIISFTDRDQDSFSRNSFLHKNCIMRIAYAIEDTTCRRPLQQTNHAGDCNVLIRICPISFTTYRYIKTGPLRSVSLSQIFVTNQDENYIFGRVQTDRDLSIWRIWLNLNTRRDRLSYQHVWGWDF